MLYTDGTGRFYRGDLQPGDREATPEEVAAYEAARADSPAKWQARARERARVMINSACDAVNIMINRRAVTDPTLANLQQFSASLETLLSVDLSASTNEKTAWDILWAAYLPMVAGFPSPIRAEYAIVFNRLTKALA